MYDQFLELSQNISENALENPDVFATGMGAALILMVVYRVAASCCGTGKKLSVDQQSLFMNIKRVLSSSAWERDGEYTVKTTSKTSGNSDILIGFGAKPLCITIRGVAIHTELPKWAQNELYTEASELHARLTAEAREASLAKAVASIGAIV